MRTFSWVGLPSSSRLMEPAAVGHAAVVDDGDFFAGDLLSDEAGEGGGFFAVEVGFKAVAHGFVQQDAGPAGAEDDGHLACGGGDGVELEDGGAGGFAGVVLGRVAAFKEVEGDAAAAATGSARGGSGAFVAAGVLGDDEDVEAGERLGVRGEGAVGCGDEDAAELVVESGADLGDAAVEGAGGVVGALDQLRVWRRFRRRRWRRRWDRAWGRPRCGGSRTSAPWRGRWR